MLNSNVVNYESGRIIFGEPETFYRMSNSISNSDLALIEKDPSLVEWNRRISDSSDLISSSVEEGRLFHKVLLETDFYKKATEFPVSIERGVRYIPRTIKVYSDGKIDACSDEVFTSLTALRNRLKSDGFDIKTTTSLEKCLHIIDAENLPYTFVENEQAKAEIEGYDFLDTDQVTKFWFMSESLIANENFKTLYESSWYGEVSLYLNGSEFTYNIPLKGRVDLMTTYNGRHYLVDIKTISSIDNVQRNIYEYNYFRQAAFYKYLYCQLLNVQPEQVDFIFAFVETSPKLGKYRSLIAKVSDEHLQKGLEQMNTLLTVYSEHLNRDKNELNFAVL